MRFPKQTENPHSLPTAPEHTCSPVPELFLAKIGSGLIRVQFQKNFNNIERKEKPLCVGNEGVFLIQGDENGIY